MQVPYAKGLELEALVNVVCNANILLLVHSNKLTDICVASNSPAPLW
jgi:hypothetical protein